LNDIVISIHSLVDSQAVAQSVLIEKNLQKNLPEVSVDAEQIKQVLLNLAINSLQAMSEGGLLTFRTSEDENFCLIEVEDSGGGIDEKILPKIFEPFFTTREKGVGLGLSVAYKIVMQHGGKLSVTSNRSNTVFSLQLPKNQRLFRTGSGE
jgi:signal transduction histidine kinase